MNPFATYPWVPIRINCRIYHKNWCILCNIVKPENMWTPRIWDLPPRWRGFLTSPTLTCIGNYSKAYNYLDALKRRGYNPRQRRWGRCSLTNCPHIFGLYYKLTRMVQLQTARDMPNPSPAANPIILQILIQTITSQLLNFSTLPNLLTAILLTADGWRLTTL